MTLQIIRTIAELRAATSGWRKAVLKSAVVPTMGALHEGHLTLVREGLKHADRCVATLFVNPKQFAANEDLGRYPRDEAGDAAKLESAGAHLLYAPAPEVMYPPNFATTVSLTGPAGAGLEDRFRPEFFAGVATVVAKLFNQCQCDFAMFGEKDYQQLQVVKRMAADLDIPVEVVPVPTIREADGLAMSSRNAYLSAEERAKAVAIYTALTQAAATIRNGLAPDEAAAKAAASLADFRVDYVEARSAGDLARVEKFDQPLRLLAAAWLGKTRLIDNVAV
ncbi:MAG: pantoate--beta-alanine ligase [Aestuariivirgaceae bacterium]|nr:pantoate--beta-alanine ligase [Aestuariivirgaceae bacterium]